MAHGHFKSVEKRRGAASALAAGAEPGERGALPGGAARGRLLLPGHGQKPGALRGPVLCPRGLGRGEEVGGGRGSWEVGGGRGK